MQTLELSILTSLIKVYRPSGLWFNPYGVSMKCYRWKLYDEGAKYLRIEVACCNGLWGGSCHVMDSMWGFGGPIIERDFKFTTLRECVEHLWCTYFIGRARNEKTKWLKKAESCYEQFMALDTEEEQLSLFREVNTYERW